MIKIKDNMNFDVNQTERIIANDIKYNVLDVFYVLPIKFFTS